MNDDGYIKFTCEWIDEALPDKISIMGINDCRKQLYQKSLIGAYSDGIGYGNISIRLNVNSFLISGTTTGNIQHLTREHYTIVTNYNMAKNSLVCKGPMKASSESLTHAIIYESVPSANAVIHVHNEALWTKLKYKVPTTSAAVKYGTPQMAVEVSRLLETTDLKSVRTLVMAGHTEGLIVFGQDPNEALQKLWDLLRL